MDNVADEFVKKFGIRVDKVPDQDKTKLLIKIGDGLLVAKTYEAVHRLYKTLIVHMAYEHIRTVDAYEKRENRPWYKKIFD